MDDITRPKTGRPSAMAASQPGKTAMPPRSMSSDVTPMPTANTPITDAPAAPARPVPISSPEPVDPSEEATKPIFSDGGPAMDAPPKSETEKPQHGAGLDLSSLSDEDAEDLGINPATGSSQPGHSRHKEEYPTGQPKKHGHGGAILAAVLIALCLIGGAGYAYWQNSKKTPAPTPTPTNVNTNSSSNSDPSAEIDKAAKDLDASLNKVNDTTDYTANDLTDSTLGL